MGISLDEVILDASTSSIAISDGTDTLAVNGDGSINATVSATDLDIRNLTFATDKVDASGSEVSLDAATLAALESITVTATDLDIRDLTHATDSVKIGDGTDFLAVNADGSINTAFSSTVDDDEAHTENGLPMAGRAVSGALAAVSATGDKYDLLGDLYRRTWVNTSRNVAMLNSQATVTATAAQVLVSALAGRREVTIQNEGSQPVYIGSSAGVTSANGIKISKNASATFEFGEDIDIYMISESGSQDVRFLESA